MILILLLLRVSVILVVFPVTGLLLVSSSILNLPFGSMPDQKLISKPYPDPKKYHFGSTTMLNVGGCDKVLDSPGVYILENISSPGGRKYQPMSFGGENMKWRREKGGKCKRKRKKGERKRKRRERK
jgi:hypothetical protein